VIVLIPLSVIAGCLGVASGLVFRRTIPAFLVGLVCTFVDWILGSAFGLAAGFGKSYQIISRCTPFTHTVELLFPRYFGVVVGTPVISVLVLTGMVLVMVCITVPVYRVRILRQM